MKEILSIIFLVFLLCRMTPATEASPLPSSSLTDKSALAYKTPDLSSLFGLFSGGMDLKTLLGFVREFKLLGDILVKMKNVSPLFTQVIDTTASKNVKLRVLLEVAEGKFPDLRDLYLLATTKTDSIAADLNNTRFENTEYQKLTSIWTQKDVLTSAKKLSDFFDKFTSRKYRFKSSVLKALNSGNDVAVSQSDLPEKNLIEFLMFLKQNKPVIDSLFYKLGSNLGDFSGLLQTAAKLDLTHLTAIRASPKNVNNGKYTITSAADPDVVKILQDLKEAESLARTKKTTEVQPLLFDIIEKGFDVFSRVVKQAEVGTLSDQDLAGK